jgi:hypothetical protein
MKPVPAILRRPSLWVETPRVQAPLKRLLAPSRLRSVMGAVQLRTQSVMDYLAVTLLKSW